jgi:hypothetical protein
MVRLIDSTDRRNNHDYARRDKACEMGRMLVKSGHEIMLLQLADNGDKTGDGVELDPFEDF